ncbi:MAG: hypothetical protein ACI8XX_002209 [Polaribacter sp.]|jgi:uncharacterized protein (DUF58 family)
MAIKLFALPAPIRRYFDDWVARHNPPSYDRIELHNRRLYILPTRFGYMLAVMLLMLFLTAVNYQNSMGFVLTFMLIALAIVSLWQTHKNILGLEVYLQTPKPVFAGESCDLHFEISHRNNLSRYAIGIQYADQTPVYLAIEPDSQSQAVIKIPSAKRGQFKPKGLTVFTRYPTGLLHSWGWLKFDIPILIYPTPLASSTLQQNILEQHDGKKTTHTIDGDDFAGLREHRKGESLRHVSWKAYAQGKGLLTKTFQGHARPSLWIDWYQLRQNSIESKLSEMTYLVLLANAKSQKYGVKLPNITIEKKQGAAHKHACLKAIATYRQVDFGLDFDPKPNSISDTDTNTDASSE